jgi:hypothetical protein
MLDLLPRIYLVRKRAMQSVRVARRDLLLIENSPLLAHVARDFFADLPSLRQTWAMKPSRKTTVTHDKSFPACRCQRSGETDNRRGRGKDKQASHPKVQWVGFVEEIGRVSEGDSRPPVDGPFQGTCGLQPSEAREPED